MNLTWLEEKKALDIVLDARVAAIRWDVIPWALVLDLDIRSSEKKNAPMHRCWVVFESLAEIDWPLCNTPLLNGCWIASGIEKKILNDTRIYSFHAFMPTVDKHGNISKEFRHLVTIKSKSLIGIITTGNELPTKGILTWENRTNLAVDNDFIKTYRATTGEIIEEN